MRALSARFTMGSWRVRPWLLGLGLLMAAVFLWRSNAFWNALSPVTQKQALYRLAGEAKVDPLLLAAIVRSESSFNPFAE
jgi:soluble lytic murein transglycosylase-like protein